MKKNFLKSQHFVTIIFFICVTIAALVFHNPHILYWYFVGAAMEIVS